MGLWAFGGCCSSLLPPARPVAACTPRSTDRCVCLPPLLQLSCSWGLHTALWRLLHPLTYNNKEQRAVFAGNGDYVKTAAAALSLPNSGERAY